MRLRYDSAVGPESDEPDPVASSAGGFGFKNHNSSRFATRGSGLRASRRVRLPHMTTSARRITPPKMIPAHIMNASHTAFFFNCGSVAIAEDNPEGSRVTAASEFSGGTCPAAKFDWPAMARHNENQHMRWRLDRANLGEITTVHHAGTGVRLRQAPATARAPGLPVCAGRRS